MSPYDGDDSSCEDEQTDTIDLTRSSPEPPQRQHAVPHRSRVAPAIQQLGLTDVKAEAAPGREGASRIDHVYRIIRTSDAQAIQSVLFNLCKMSPALCGAIARGLAPHSTYAQNVIRGARKNTAPAPATRPMGIKAEQRPGPASRERSKNFKSKQEQTPARHQPLPNSRGENGRSPLDPVPTGLSARGVAIETPSSLEWSSSEEMLELPSIPKSVKKERVPSPARLDDSSSTAFSDVPPTIRQRTTTTSLPLRPPTADPVESPSNIRNHFKSTRMGSESLARSTIKADPLLSGQSLFERPSSSDDDLEPQLLICQNCNQTIGETRSDVCYYHPGHKRRALPGAGPGSLRYDCCQQGVLSRGCESGRHATNRSPQRRTRPPSSSSPTLQRPSKAPRLR